MPLNTLGKNACYINNFTHVLIASGRLQLKYLGYQWIHLCVESKNIFVSFLYDEANMSYVRLIMLRQNVSVSKHEQPCLVYLGQKL